MNKNNITIAIIGALVLILLLIPKSLYYILNLSFDPKNVAICKAEERALEEQLNGIVIDKYNDSINHNYETIKLKHLDSIYSSIIFVLDNSDAFQIIEIGDSVIKKTNDLNLYVFKKFNNMTIKLEFDCEK